MRRSYPLGRMSPPVMCNIHTKSSRKEPTNWNTLLRSGVETVCYYSTDYISDNDRQPMAFYSDGRRHSILSRSRQKHHGKRMRRKQRLGTSPHLSLSRVSTCSNHGHDRNFPCPLRKIFRTLPHSYSPNSLSKWQQTRASASQFKNPPVS